MNGLGFSCLCCPALYHCDKVSEKSTQRREGLSWLTVLAHDQLWRTAMEPRCSVHGCLEVGREEGKEEGGGERREAENVIFKVQSLG